MHPVPSSRSILDTAVARRTTLGLGLGVVSLLSLSAAGCDLDDLPGGGTPSSTSEAAVTEDDPDQAVLDGVLADLDARLAAVVAARAALPRLRRTLKPLEEMHRAHRAVLDPDPGAPATPAGALDAVRAGETAHQAALVAASVACRSGALARLLASVSASVSQHLAVLPTQLAPR